MSRFATRTVAQQLHYSIMSFLQEGAKTRNCIPQHEGDTRETDAQRFCFCRSCRSPGSCDRSGVRRGGGKPSHPAATTADVPVTVAHGATVRLAGGTTLVIPPGAVSADGRLIAHADGSQVGTNLGLDGRPGAAKPVFASAGSAVTFELTGANLVRPAALTVQVDPAAFAQAGTAANRPDAAWLAFYDAAAHRWQHVDSRYDPAALSVTAQVPHLSTWNPFTWDQDS
jgi:hypothetical protein